MITILTALLFLSSCSSEMDDMPITNTQSAGKELKELPQRTGERPATTNGIPHVQIDLDKLPEIHEEMVRRIFTVPGIINEPSAILSWEGLWIDDNNDVINPAFLSGREFGHIHDDGSLHIFLEPSRAQEAIDMGWAVLHPFAAEGQTGWEGFVMLYTPQTIEELNVVFQLIIEAYNYITGQEIDPKDFY